MDEQRPRRAVGETPEFPRPSAAPSHHDDDPTLVRGGLPVQPPRTAIASSLGHGHGAKPIGQKYASGPSLRRSLLLTAASAVVPGSGLLGAKSRAARIVGAVTGSMAVACLGVVGYALLSSVIRSQGKETSKAWLARQFAKVAVEPAQLFWVTCLLVIAGLIWVGLIASTHLLTRPFGLHTGRRALGAVLVTALAFGVAAPTAVAARYAQDQAMLLEKIFGKVKAAGRPDLSGPDPWADVSRLNILLLGADGDASRRDRIKQFGLRTDTMMVASIDTKTGDTALIQVPRNVQHTPFPEGSEMDKVFPEGFRGEPAADWFINSIWAKVELDYPNLFKGATYRGAEALKQGMEGVTGLKMDYFVMLNIDGLQKLIDAMGGVTVNVNERIPVGGNTDRGIRPSRYIEPGKDKHLGGYDAMWYARGRYGVRGGDYGRMARQSCLVGAIVRQANPTTMVTRYEAIAAAGSEMVMTDIPQKDLAHIVDLAFRVQGGKVSRLVFSPGKNGYSYANPDFEAMRAAVSNTIDPGKPKAPAASASTTPKHSQRPKKAAPTGSPDSSAGTLTQGSQDVNDACAYHGE